MSDRVTVQLPDEPCVVLSDGDAVVVHRDRFLEPLRQWAQSVGPVGRAVMAARLRALADQIQEIP